MVKKMSVLNGIIGLIEESLLMLEQIMEKNAMLTTSL